jgi:pimeloyl-ACP methyl ester carboxylesterase
VRDIPIHYEEVGEGTPVVVLHGLSLEHRLEIATFEPIFSERSDTHGWRRIYPDMPGHGATPAPDWLDSDDQVLEILRAFVDLVAPGERLVVIGASWGAYLAHAFASQHADRIDGLLMSVPVVHAERTRRDLPPRTVLVSDPGTLADVKPGEEAWLDFSVVQTREMLERYRAVPLQPADERFLERLEPRYAYSFEDELTARIEAPALIVAGRQDSIVGYRNAWSLLQHLPRATFAVLDRAGHALEDEQWRLFQALTHEWLDRVIEHASGRDRISR